MGWVLKTDEDFRPRSFSVPDPADLAGNEKGNETRSKTIYNPVR